MTATVPIIAALSSRGIIQIEGPDSYKENFLQDDKSSNYRSIIFSSNGAYFAWRNDSKVEILRCSDWNVVASIPGAVKEMQFSPNGIYLMVWENFVMNAKYPQGRPNMHVYKSDSGMLIQSFIQRDQIDWAPFWSSDEKVFARLDNKRVLVYEDDNLEQYTQQINCDKFKSFSLAPSKIPPYHFVTFTAGSSGKPSHWKLFKFPSFDLTQALAGKTFFQGDRAEFYWNNRGTNLLIMTHTDVDKSGASYYGKQCLHYGDVKGNSIIITFSKEGPIHAVSWNPGNWNEFCAVYGHAPAKATLFNTKCEPIFEFGTGGWNSIYFSPGGSRLLLGGFGNIALGNIAVWDPATHRQLGTCTAPDTTLLQWDPRAECFVTATTYPRLTVANGFKIWHYTCVLMYEKPWEKGENLLSITWQPGNFPKSNLSASVPQGIANATPKPSAQPYRPPGAKGRPSNFVFHEHEAPHKPGHNAGAPPSKAAVKQKEKREKQKVKKAEEKAKQLETGDGATPVPKPSNRTAFHNCNNFSTGDPEKDKKIKNVLKKLDAIDKLKETKASGRQLEVNQQAKIETEKTLLTELAQLKL